MSFEITLGLLSALTGNVHAACQYWLQALSSCNKNCLFPLQRQLCCMLLPNGIRSLDNLLRLSHKLCSENAFDGPTRDGSVRQLFEHFRAYYCKALLSELWYRCPEILAIFQCNQAVSVKDQSDNGHTGSVVATEVGDSECESKPSKDQNTLEISDSSQTNGDEQIKEEIRDGVACLTAVDVDSKSLASKEPLSSSKSGKQDLISTLRKVKGDLLSDHHVKLLNLRELLTEIRKAMLLKRSRQFLQLGSTSSQLNQKKRDKKPKVPSAQSIGFSTNTSEGVSTSETASLSSSNDPAECGQTENIENGAFTETSEVLTEVKDTSVTTGDKTVYGTLDGSRDKVPESEGVLEDLKTIDGKVPIDLRFAASDTSLEFLIEEEEKVLKELEQFEFKVCYY